MKFDYTVLNKLLDRYESSKQSYISNTKQRKIRLNVMKDILFEKYWAEDSYLFRDDIEHAINKLSDMSLITYEKDEDSDRLKYINLNLNNIDNAFIYLKREKKTLIDNNEMDLIQTMLEKASPETVVYNFCEELIKKIENREPRNSIYKSISELKTRLEFIKEVEQNDEEILLRNFSKKKFGDSKIFEKNQFFIFKTFNKYDRTKYLDFDDLCKKHYIVKSHGYAYIKNGLVLQINKQIVNLDDLGTELSLSDEAIEKLEIKSISTNKVITVENLTTFHYFDKKDYSVIYLGGFHNSTKRKLIEKIKIYKPSLEWYHFGDIDWGGFQILLDLRKKTGITFIPYLMGIEQLKKYASECGNLTTLDRNKLEILKKEQNEFNETIDYMLENNIKLEQESIVFLKE